jgi:hypothetical protein
VMVWLGKLFTNGNYQGTIGAFGLGLITLMLLSFPQTAKIIQSNGMVYAAVTILFFFSWIIGIVRGFQIATGSLSTGEAPATNFFSRVGDAIGRMRGPGGPGGGPGGRLPPDPGAVAALQSQIARLSADVSSFNLGVQELDAIWRGPPTPPPLPTSRAGAALRSRVQTRMRQIRTAIPAITNAYITIQSDAQFVNLPRRDQQQFQNVFAQLVTGGLLRRGAAICAQFAGRRY